MSKTHSPKNPFSIVFVRSVDNSNNKIKWTKVNFMLPADLTPPTFDELHNSFKALDVNNYEPVIRDIGLVQYSTTTSEGETDTRYQDLVLTSSLIYYIK